MTPASVAPPGDYLTTGQVARRIGSTSQHVRRLINSGLLAAIDIASGTERPRFRVAEDAVVEYLRDAKVKPGDRAPGALRIPDSVLNSMDPPSEEVA
ncbi:helix-turn-helix domain-containing protein [Streptomyces sp. NPDC056670]|uniref:helix-turn-helix domain-containing protein n=1 Tax=Streptomyces sp. NPDC056670 TaxID=3345904 RepID=UPI00368ABCBD